MPHGGMFRGQPWQNATNNTENRWMMCWGRLIAPPQTVTFRKTKTTCTIKLHVRTFQNITVWEDSPAFPILSMCEKGDTILVFGTQTVTPYVTKAGEHKVSQELVADMIIPQQLINSILDMATNANIAKLMSMDDGIEGDALESAGDERDAEDMVIPEDPDVPFE